MSGGESPEQSGGSLLRHAGFLLLGWLAGQVAFRLLCRLRVEGREHVPSGRNVLLVANHRSLADSWLICAAAFGGRLVTERSLAPWSPAAVENFLDTPLKRYVFGRLLRCLPVDRRTFDRGLLDDMAAKLRRGTMIAFPEGTRTRTGRMLPRAGAGIGYLIRQARPTVIPVFHSGTEKVLPVGRARPSFGHRILVRFGPPVELDRFFRLPHSRATWEGAARSALEAVARLETESPSAEAPQAAGLPWPG